MLFRLTAATADLTKTMARDGGYGDGRHPNASAFLEDLIVLCGPQLVAERKAGKHAEDGGGAGSDRGGDPAAELRNGGPRMEADH